MIRLSICLYSVLSLAALALGLFPAEVVERATPAANALTIEDMAGRKVGFARAPERVAIYPPLQIAFMTIDGAADRLAAISDSFRSAARESILGRMFPRLELLPSSGRAASPEPERFLLLHPESAVIRKSTGDILEKMGVRGLVEIDYSAENYKSSRLKLWRLLGIVAGKSKRAEELVSPFTQVVSDIQGHLSRAKARATSVLWIWSGGSNFWGVLSARNYQNDFLRSAGGVNLAQSAAFKFRGGIEQILLCDPEVILLDPPVDSHGPIPQTLYDDVVWRTVRAVRAHRVYTVPRYFEGNPSVDEALLETWLAEVLHPDAMPRMTRAAYRDLYEKAYGYEITDREIDQILFVVENSRSYGYARFSSRDSHPTACRFEDAGCPDATVTTSKD